MDPQLRDDYDDRQSPEGEERRSTQSFVSGVIILMCAAFLFPCLLGLFLHLWHRGRIG